MSPKACSASDDTMTAGSCLTPNGSVSLRRSARAPRGRAHINGELATSMKAAYVELKSGSYAGAVQWMGPVA